MPLPFKPPRLDGLSERLLASHYESGLSAASIGLRPGCVQVSGDAVAELRRRGLNAQALSGGIAAWHAIGGPTVAFTKLKIAEGGQCHEMGYARTSGH